MHRYIRSFILISFLFISCREKATEVVQPAIQYDKLLFEREGGGNLVFTVMPSASADTTFEIEISKISYCDTSLTKLLTINSNTGTLLDTLLLALKGEIKLQGNFQQSSLPTGTWASIYLVNGQGKTEVTDEHLRNVLLRFESLVRFECSNIHSAGDLPPWVMELISKYQIDPVGNPPQSIWQYEYKGNTVYYIPPQCCDQYSILYNAYGDILCAPDGGLTGTGDGRCTDFIRERKNELLVWKDSRTR